jgi:hypothetical protein
MRHALLSATIVMIGCATNLAEAGGYGKYACYVDRSVGIIHSDPQTAYAGQIALPGSRTHFLLTIKPIKQDSETINLCKESVSYYLKILEDRVPYPTDTPFDRGVGPRTVIGNHCFTRDEAVLKYPIEEKDSTLRGYNDGLDAEHFSDVQGNWIEFSGNTKFNAVVQYENGPVIEEGHCDKIAATE